MGEAGDVRKLADEARALVDRDPRRGLELAVRAVKRAREQRSPDLLCALTVLAQCECSLSDFERARVHADEARRLVDAGETGDDERLAGGLFNLGDLSATLESADEALACFEESLRIRRTLGDRDGEAAALEAMALICKDRRDLDRAMEHAQASYEIRAELGAEQGVDQALGTIGRIQMMKGDHTAALASYRAALQLGSEDARERAVKLLGLGSALRAAGDLNAAQDAVESAHGLLEEGADLDLHEDIHRELAGLFEETGATDRALAHFKRYHELRESALRDRADTTIRSLQISYELVRTRDEAARVLRESEARYRMLVENSPHCIHELDLDGRLISMNAAGLAMMHAASEREIVGTRYLDAVAAEDRPRIEEMLRRAVRGEGSGFEFTAVNGRIFDSSFVPLRNQAGTVYRLMGLTQDVTERRRVEAELRRLTTRLQEARETERAAVAQQVHDEFGQALTGLKLDLAWMAERESDAQLRERAVSMIELVDETLEAARSLAQRMRPAVLDDLGLEAAIEWQAQEFARRTGCLCGLDLRPGELPRNRARDTAVFRIFQEALTNIARHADATQIDVQLKQSDGTLWLEVRDDGKGITAAALGTGSMGLVGMNERAKSIDAELIIRRGPSGGTVLRVGVPIP